MKTHLLQRIEKVVVKVFDKLTGGRREKDRIHQDGDEYIELRLRPGDAYEMDGVREYFIHSRCLPCFTLSHCYDFSLDSSCKNRIAIVCPKTTAIRTVTNPRKAGASINRGGASVSFYGQEIRNISRTTPARLALIFLLENQLNMSTVTLPDSRRGECILEES